jgi:hypothetical protein
MPPNFTGLLTRPGWPITELAPGVRPPETPSAEQNPAESPPG